MSNPLTPRRTNYRWIVCSMLFFATLINYLDRQVLSLTWKDFIAPEFHWTNTHYGNITAFFSVFYAISMLFAGRFVDRLDTRKGYLWAIGIWSAGACLHAFCGILTSGIISGNWLVSFHGARETIALVDNTSMVASVSVTLFIFARMVLALGEAGNYPAAIKAVAEYFPKKDRALATSLFDAGSVAGALAAPLSIPFIAQAWGWETAFIVIGALGFVWMGIWVFVYKKPEVNPGVNELEIAYIREDHENIIHKDISRESKVTFRDCLRYRQTWAFALGKLLTDGVWFFFLFWTPAYLSSVYGIKSSDPMGQLAIFMLYLISLVSIIGGWLPSYFVEKRGMNPYAGRMRTMLIFASFLLVALLAQPLGHISYWLPITFIGIAMAGHQAWSANIFSTVGDMFPKKAIATVIGIGGMAGGIGAFIINKSSGVLFDYAAETQMRFMGFKGEEAGYFIVFSVCAFSHLAGWVVMKALVPVYKPITDL
ncbi:MFS transporter [Pararcticibacter amylolyticus]|uniref:MFS transporter n=1 Tax=Pararcticibacter amylolyticus TaxID=2173175 RepID=A0A2U2PJM6_9SPHI|nr:MFS transporter [Pararcticibacter amylolyticus]PWG81464.1 MFS transporter [Pararcticibacter amylolyticus]